MKHSPLVILGIDAGDPVFIQRWGQEGYLPTIASILERGCWARTGGPELVPIRFLDRAHTANRLCSAFCGTVSTQLWAGL
jgi:hypothetical protein